MASKYWLKLFHETIYDPKIMMRSPGARLRWYECLCLAGDYDKDGELPPIEHMLYVFRIPEDQLIKELEELVSPGLLTYRDGVYSITNWHDRQSAMDTNERSMRYRETQQKREYYEPVTKVKRECNDNATVRDADIDIDKEEKRVDADTSPMQLILEKITGIPPANASDIQAMTDIEKMNPLEEDIQGGLNWILSQGKHVQRYSSLVGPIKTAITMRMQKKSGPAPKPYKDPDGNIIMI